MFRWVYLAIAVLALTAPDASKIAAGLRPLVSDRPLDAGPMGNLENGSAQPAVFVSVAQSADTKQPPLQPKTRLELVRFVSGEFAHAVKPVPGARKGYHVPVGKPLDENALRYALANTGIAVNPGDMVQITHLEFREKEIAVDLNGGSAHHFHLRDHLQVGMSAPTMSSVSSPGRPQAAGATLVLDFGKPLPDISPDDLKQDLSLFLSFEKEKSAAVNWIDTLPPEIKKAIEENHALVGMDHDMVIAALGRPDHKVRERNDQGDETEDWIYGTPPAKTIFVTFLGDKVTRVKEFN